MKDGFSCSAPPLHTLSCILCPFDILWHSYFIVSDIRGALISGSETKMLWRVLHRDVDVQWFRGNRDLSSRVE